MTTTPLLPMPAAPAASRSLAHRLLTLVLPWTLVLLLVTTNAMTLLNQQMYSAGRSRVELVAATVRGQVSQYGLWRSPAPRPSATREDDLEGLRKQNTLYATRQKSLELAMTTLQRQNTEIKGQQGQAEDRFRKLQSQHTHVQEENRRLEHDREALKKASLKRAGAVRNIASRITRRMALRAGAAASELPIRAAPYIGIGALVTATALDIKSDCELAGVLNGLVLEHDEPPLDTNAVCQYADKIPAPAQLWGVVESRANTLLKPLYKAIRSSYP